MQDALYDAEEYLRAEVAAHPGKSEADVLELIASTYGAPEEVATAYRDTEVKVKAALRNPAPRTPHQRLAAGALLRRIPRSAHLHLALLHAAAPRHRHRLLHLRGDRPVAVAGFAVLVIGIPFFLAFIGVARVIALGEGRLLEAVTGERMPRRPVHPGPAAHWWDRIIGMLKDLRTWTTLAYLALMLPLGILYFTVAVLSISIVVGFIGAPLLLGGRAARLGQRVSHNLSVGPDTMFWHAHQGLAAVVLFVMGILIGTLLMHLVRATVRAHARMAKFLLAVPSA